MSGGTRCRRPGILIDDSLCSASGGVVSAERPFTSIRVMRRGWSCSSSGRSRRRRRHRQWSSVHVVSWIGFAHFFGSAPTDSTTSSVRPDLPSLFILPATFADFFAKICPAEAHPNARTEHSTDRYPARDRSAPPARSDPAFWGSAADPAADEELRRVPP